MPRNIHGRSRISSSTAVLLAHPRRAGTSDLPMALLILISLAALLLAAGSLFHADILQVGSVSTDDDPQSYAVAILPSSIRLATPAARTKMPAAIWIKHSRISSRAIMIAQKLIVAWQ